MAVSPAIPQARSQHMQLGLAAVVLANVLWSLGPIFVKKTGLVGLNVAFWRIWVGAAILLGACLVSGHRVTWADFRRCAWAGVLFAINIGFFFSAVHETSVANATVISSLTPVIVVPMAAWLWHERSSRLALICGGVALAGTVIAVLSASPKSGRTWYGDLLAVASLISWAAFFMTTKRVRATVGTMEFLTSMTIAAALTLTAFTVPTADHLTTVPGRAWFWIVMLAVFPGACGHGLMTWAHAHVDVSTSSMIATCEPIIAAIFAWAILSEPLTGIQVFGVVVVVGALGVLAGRSARSHTAP